MSTRPMRAGRADMAIIPPPFRHFRYMLALMLSCFSPPCAERDFAERVKALSAMPCRDMLEPLFRC